MNTGDNNSELTKCPPGFHIVKARNCVQLTMLQLIIKLLSAEFDLDSSS